MEGWSDKLLQKCMTYIETDSVQNTLHQKILTPILNHVLKRVFPYIVLICVMFILLLLSVLITLGVILFQTRTPYIPNMASAINVS